MAIDDNTLYGLTGAQIKELPGKVKEMIATNGIVDLTSDDYNYPAGSPDGVSLWDKPTGIYRTNDLTKVYFGTVDNSTTKGLFIVFPGNASGNTRIFRMDAYAAEVLDYTISTATGTFITRNKFIESNEVVDNLTSTFTDTPLSANQGKVLNDKITSIGAGTRRATPSGWNTNSSLDYILGHISGGVYDGVQGVMFPAGDNLSDFPTYAGLGMYPAETPADGLGPRPYLIRQTTQDDNTGTTTGTVTATRIAIYDELPVITLTTTDPGEGATLAENHFIAVYNPN